MKPGQHRRRGLKARPITYLSHPCNRSAQYKTPKLKGESYGNEKGSKEILDKKIGKEIYEKIGDQKVHDKKIFNQKSRNQKDSREEAHFKPEVRQGRRQERRA